MCKVSNVSRQLSRGRGGHSEPLFEVGCIDALRKSQSTGFDEGAALKVRNGLTDLILRVHHDRTVPGNRLLEWLPGHQQEADAFVAGLHRHLVAVVEQHERTVAD